MKLANKPGEAGALRLLAYVYRKRGDTVSALRCIEQVIEIDQCYSLPQYNEDQRFRHQLVEEDCPSR